MEKLTDNRAFKIYGEFVASHLKKFNQIKPYLPSIKTYSVFAPFRNLFSVKKIKVTRGPKNKVFQNKARDFEKVLFDTFQQFPEYRRDKNFIPIFAAMASRGHDFEQNNLDHDRQLEIKEDEKNRNEILLDLIKAAGLTHRERQIYLARESDGATYARSRDFKEIAKRYGIAHSTARNLYYRACKRLQRWQRKQKLLRDMKSGLFKNSDNLDL